MVFGDIDLQKHNVFSRFLAKKWIPLRSGDAHAHQTTVFIMIYVTCGFAASKPSVFTMICACQNIPVLSLFLYVLNVSCFTIYSVIFGRISIIFNKKQQFLQ